MDKWCRRGIGQGLAATVPWLDARIINLSRRQHPQLETVLFDLTEPESWTGVQKSFETELHDFKGKRAIFIHNAFVAGRPAFVAESNQADSHSELIANGMAPLVLGNMFLRAIQPGYESGLVLMSSAAARSPFEGHAIYCAAKAGVEMWVRVARRELKRRGRQTWVVAIRPGFVDTPATRFESTMPAEIYPIATQMARQLATGEGVMTPEEAGRGIWAMLPPKGESSVLLQGEMVVDSTGA